MYSNIKSCVSVEGDDSPFFFSNRGVRQGDNISPVLFSLFLNDLEDYFEAERREGIPVECMTERMYFFMQVYVLLYADDTVIMSKSPEDLQQNLNIFAQYCLDWKLDVNKSKTKIVIFGARKNCNTSFSFDNLPLDIVDSYKYLGLFFSKSRSILNARKHLLEQAKKAMHLLLMRTKNLFLPVDLQLKLFDQTVLPILTYGCEVFGFENCGLLETVHTQFLRSILRARKSTPLYMLYGELGRFPIELSIKCRMINYWVRLISQNIESKISFKMYQKLRATPTMNSKWIQKIKEIFEETGRPDIWLNESPNTSTTRIIKQNLMDQYQQKWNACVEKSSKGINYRIFKNEISLENYFLKLPVNLYLNLAKLRTENHRFPCERGRWQGIELEDRKCTLCTLQDVGDVYHYVMTCPFFKETREKYIPKYYYIRPNTIKFKELMNCQNEIKQRHLAIFAKTLIRTVQ